MLPVQQLLSEAQIVQVVAAHRTGQQCHADQQRKNQHRADDDVRDAQRVALTCEVQRQRYGHGNAGLDRYARRLSSWRPRVTVSRINPQANDSRADMTRPVHSTAVGKRGTWPVS